MTNSIGSDKKITLKKTGELNEGQISQFAKPKKKTVSSSSKSQATESEGEEEEQNPYGNPSPKNHISRFKRITKGAEVDIPSRRGSIDAKNQLNIAPGLTLQDIDDDNDDLCMICYTNQCDSVVLPCGHGNACSKCNHIFISDTGKCFVCRSDVVQMLRVDVENLRNDCMKVLGATFYVKKQDENESGDEKTEVDEEQEQ